MKFSKFFITLGLTATFTISSVVGLPKPKEALTQQASRPVAILVNGQGDCCAWKMENTINALKNEMRADVYVVPWNSFDEKEENDSELNDARFLREVAEYVNNIPAEQPVILIGHSFGGDSVLKVAHRINRRILFLGVLDPVATLGQRSPVTGYGVPSNVDYFFNRWQTNAPWPVDLGNGTVQNCNAIVCDQKEQSFALNADGSEIIRNCRADEFCRNRSGGTVRRVVDFLGDVIRDDYGTAHKRLLHEPFPTDAHIQQQIVDKLRTLVVNYQPPNPPTYAFGYAKNSRLVASGSSPEPMEGHVNWAKGQSESTVKIEVISAIRQAQFMISQLPSAQSCEAFGHLKNAALTLLRNTTEPHAGHVNWCRDRLNENNWGQVVQAVEQELISPMLGALGVSSPASERLDYTFGYAKNSRLVASSSSPEPMEGHINWALRQNPSTVKNEILSQISQTQSIISQSPSIQSCEAFGYLKNATLTLLRNTTEPHAGHVNWCRDRLNENNWNQVIQAVEQEFINPMRAALGQ